MSSAKDSTTLLYVCGSIPKWLPVRLQFEAGSEIQLIFAPTRLSNSRPIKVTSAVSIPNGQKTEQRRHSVH